MFARISCVQSAIVWVMCSVGWFDVSPPSVEEVLAAWTKYRTSVANHKLEMHTKLTVSQGESMSFTRALEATANSSLSITTNHWINANRKADEVVGKSRDYVYRLVRASENRAWTQVELYAERDWKTPSASALLAKLERDTGLIQVGPVSLASLLSRAGVSTKCSMAGDTVVVDFTATNAPSALQPFGKGQVLLDRVPPFLPKKVTASLPGSDRIDYEIVVSWKMEGTDAQFPETVRLIQRNGEHTITGTSTLSAVTLGMAKEVDFRLTRFGLPEPPWLTPATPEPTGVPWTIYGVAAGFGLLIVCILLSRRKAAA